MAWLVSIFWATLFAAAFYGIIRQKRKKLSDVLGSCLLVTLLVVAACVVAFFMWHAFAGPLAGPATKAELCKDLGRDPRLDPLCSYKNDGELTQLLTTTFPLQVTRQDEVHRRLGKYLKHTSRGREGTFFETYAIERSLIPSLPIPARFTFDKDGTLTDIYLIDGFVD